MSDEETYEIVKPLYKIYRLDEDPKDDVWSYPRLNNINNFLEMIYEKGFILLKSKNEVRRMKFENIEQMRQLYLNELRNHFSLSLIDPPLLLSTYNKIKNADKVLFPVYAQHYYDGLRTLSYKKGIYFSNKLRTHESHNEIKLFLDYLPLNSFLDCTYYCEGLKKADITKIFKNNGYINKSKKESYKLICYINDIFIDDETIVLKDRMNILKKCFDMFEKEFKTPVHFRLNLGEIIHDSTSIHKPILIKNLNGSYYFDRNKDFFLLL